MAGSGDGVGVPDFLTVEEAARVVRIGRTSAYELARRFVETGGAEGLPVVRFGRLLRVPRCRLEEWLGGPISWPAPPAAQHAVVGVDAHHEASMPVRPRPRRIRHSSDAGESSPRLFSV
jgi:excisionase family DNA binding protein